MRSALGSFLMLCLLVSPALAETQKPQCLDDAIEAQQPYGEGHLNKLFLRVYDASLWTDAPQWSMNSVFALSIHYDLSIGKDDMVDRSLSEMQHVEPFPADKTDSYKQQLTDVLPEVQKGDTITALYDPKKGARFFHNDKLSGVIKDPVLARRFFSIWLSPNTSEPDLRASLVSAHHG